MNEIEKLPDSGAPISRVVQRQILETLRSAFPMAMNVFGALDVHDDEIIRNLLYLENHRLCEANIQQYVGGAWGWGDQSITAEGIDFLESDGGLSAIKNTLTVRLHADTVRDLISAQLDASDIPEQVKSSFKARLATLSETGLRAATTDLVQVGLTHLPNTIEWLGRFVAL